MSSFHDEAGAKTHHRDRPAADEEEASADARSAPASLLHL